MEDAPELGGGGWARSPQRCLSPFPSPPPAIASEGGGASVSGDAGRGVSQRRGGRPRARRRCAPPTPPPITAPSPPTSLRSSASTTLPPLPRPSSLCLSGDAAVGVVPATTSPGSLGSCPPPPLWSSPACRRRLSCGPHPHAVVAAALVLARMPPSPPLWPSPTCRRRRRHSDQERGREREGERKRRKEERRG